jgi:ribosomal protein L11 methyltransferase
VPFAEAENARASFLELVSEGFEEVELGDELELAAYTDALGEAGIRAAFGQVTVSEVASGWEERWREFHRPVEIAGLWVGPPWIAAPTAMLAVVVEPGRAFGTGAHPTTRASLELLVRSEHGSVLDAGCGSGVLAIAAARLGFAPVRAVDADPAAVDATRENAARNGVEIDVTLSDVLVDPLPAADLLVANIELRVVEAVLGRWAGGRAVVSGYLADEALTVRGWERGERIELDGWAAESLTRTV